MSSPVPPILLKPTAARPSFEDSVLTVLPNDSSTYTVRAFGSFVLDGVTTRQMAELGQRLLFASKALTSPAEDSLTLASAR